MEKRVISLAISAVQRPYNQNPKNAFVHKAVSRESLNKRVPLQGRQRVLSAANRKQLGRRLFSITG
jgi:hypothetical protein